MTEGALAKLAPEARTWIHAHIATKLAEAEEAVRAQVDYEESKTIRKSASIGDRILFWRKDKPEDATSAATDNATGDQPVTIERTSGGPRIRLPGT